MLRNLGSTELIIILVIVLLLFGVGRVSRIGSELGTAIREFQRGMAEEDEQADESAQDSAEM